MGHDETDGCVLVVPTSQEMRGDDGHQHDDAMQGGHMEYISMVEHS